MLAYPAISFNSARRQQLTLKIGETKRYPFVGVPFELDILLIDIANSGNIKQVTDGQHAVSLKLYYNEKPLKECPNNLMVRSVFMMYVF